MNGDEADKEDEEKSKVKAAKVAKKKADKAAKKEYVAERRVIRTEKQKEEERQKKAVYRVKRAVPFYANRTKEEKAKKREADVASYAGPT